VFLGQGVFYSRTLVSSDDEESYLSAGYLAVTGTISLYQDDMTGQRMPLPHYVLGASQVVFGRNLWAARLVSLAVGLGALMLTMYLGRQLGGVSASLLAGALLATQGAVVSYYATAGYHSLAAATLTGTVCLLVRGTPWSAVAGAGGVALLFFTRTNLFPALPLLGVWALVGARTLGLRTLAIVVGGLPVALFFLTDLTHLKLLAHVPLLDRLVEPMGYRSVFYFEPVNARDRIGLLWSLVLLGRRYESWLVATAAVVGGTFLAWSAGRAAERHPRRSEITAVAILAAWIVIWHFLIFRINFKWVAAYVPDFAPLIAVLLGVGAARFLEVRTSTRPARAIIVGGLAVAFTVSVVFVRSPLMPRPMPRPFAGDPVQALEKAAQHMRSLVDTERPIFLYGQSMPVYLAGLPAYLPQLMTPRSLTMNDQDDRAVTRSGVWGRRQLEQWLGEEAQYVIVSPRTLEAYETDRPASIARMRVLLAERFVLIGSVNDAPWLSYEVYHRRRADP
jgi:4-amino-4-deoxy-L-arabinose transferase-like glycosyltransferase